MTQPRSEYRLPRPGEVLSFLSRHCRIAKPGEGLNIAFSPCPKCGVDGGGQPTCSVHAETGLWHCFRASCMTRGNWFTLTRDFGEPLAADDRWKHPPESSRRRIDAGWAEMRGNAQRHARRPVVDGHYPELLAYLHGRGFSSATLDAWRVSTRGDKACRWPIYAWDDEQGWLAANARLRQCLDRDRGSGAKDWFEVVGGETGLLIGNHLLDLDAPERVAVITEGQWDAMTAWELGIRNVFSLPNGASHVDPARMLRYIPGDWEVILCVDMDRGGDLCAEAFFAKLGPDRLARIMMPAKDLNAWYLEAGGGLTREGVLSRARGLSRWAAPAPAAAEGAPEAIRFRELGISDDEEEPVDDETQLVADTPWPALSALLDGGFHAKQTTGILAPSGIGKTTLVNQIGIHCASRGVPTGLLSFEGDRVVLERKLVQATRGYVSPGEGRQAVRSSLFVSPMEGSDIKWPDVIGELRLLVSAKGCRILIVDNLDYIMPRANASRANDLKVAAYGRLVELSKELDAHIIVVWQPLKIEQGVVVNSGMQKGASQTFQDSDNYINLNRVDDMARLEVEKCRNRGMQKERFVWLKYEEEKRCLFQAEHAGHAAGDKVNVLTISPK